MKFPLIASVISAMSIATFASPAKADWYDCQAIARAQTYTADALQVSAACDRLYVRYPAPQVETVQETVTTHFIDGNARIRSGASFESGVIRETTSNEVVDIKSRKGDWVYFTDGSGRPGWTHENNIHTNTRFVRTIREY